MENIVKMEYLLKDAISVLIVNTYKILQTDTSDLSLDNPDIFFVLYNCF